MSAQFHPSSTASVQSSYFIIILKMIAVTFFWGGTFIAGSIASQYANAPLIGFFRFAVASLCLILVLESTHNSLRKHTLDKKLFIGVFTLALTGIFAYNMFFFWGLKTVPASRASLIVANNPLLIAIGASLFLNEKLKAKQGIGIITSIIGAIIVLSNGKLLEILTELNIGDIIIFGCVISWSIYSLVGKVVLKSLTPLIAVTWACFIGTFLFLPFMYQELNTSLLTLPLDFWLSVIYLGLFGSAVGFVWFYSTINALGAAKTGNFISFVPVFATILSIIMLGENITISFIIGGALTMFGVYLTNKK